jgi:hypothetical protein
MQEMTTVFDSFGFIDSVVGLLFGIIASFIVWWLVTRVVVPKIRFSESIADYSLPGKHRIWLCQFENTGRRQCIDLEIVVRLAIKGFEGTEDIAYHTYSTNASRVPRLKPGERRKVRLFDTRECIRFLDVPSPTIRDTIQKQPRLNSVLVLGQDAWIVVHVFCHDGFSGSRKVYSSQKYRVGNIGKGTIKEMNVVAQNSSWLTPQSPP